MIEGLLNQTVRIANFISQDAYGDPTYGEFTEVKCRIEFHVSTTRGIDGALLTTFATLYVAGFPCASRCLVEADYNIYPSKSVTAVIGANGDVHH